MSNVVLQGCNGLILWAYWPYFILMSHFEIFVTYNTHTLEPQNIVNSFTKIAVKCRTHFRYLQKMLTSKPSTLRRFWAPIYRSVLSEILGPRDPAILQRRHFVPLKPVITRNPQTRKPANPQTRKPANPQTRKPANPQTRKPAREVSNHMRLAGVMCYGLVYRKCSTVLFLGNLVGEVSY